MIKKLFFLAVGAALVTLPAIAGGPDVNARKLPELVTSPNDKNVEKSLRKIIEPIQKGRETVNKMEAGNKQTAPAYEPYTEEMTPAQPSYGKPFKTVERVIVKEPAAKRKFAVLFESNPPSADVVINGLYVGSTPVQVPLTEGVYSIRLRLAEHDAWEQQIKAYQGLRVMVMLQKGQ